MQGKEKKSLEIDKQFQDQSWKKMQQLLDTEMPVVESNKKDKKRYLLLLLILFLGFGSGAGTMFYLNQNQKENTKIEIKKDLANSTEIKPEEKLVESSLTNFQSENKLKTTSANNAVVDKKLKKPPTNYQSKIAVKSNNSRKNVTTTKSNREIAKSELIKPENDTKKIAANSSNDGFSLQPIASEITSFDYLETRSSALEPSSKSYKMDFVETPKNKKWSFGVLFGNYSNDKNVLAGMTLGGKAVYDLNAKFLVGGGLQYSFIFGFQKNSNKSEQRLAATDTSTMPENNTLDDTTNVTTGVESFGSNNSYQSLGNGDLPISNMHYLELPIEIAYRFNKKIQVNLGFKASYLIAASSNGGLNTNFSSPAETSKNLTKDLNRFDLSTSLGIGFYPSQKFGIDLRYNHGWMDYTPDNIWPQNQHDTHKNIQLSLLYFFGKK